MQRRRDSTPSATASLSAGPVLGAPTRNLGDVSLTDVFAGPPAVCYSYRFAADDEHPAAANTSRPRARACRCHLSAALRHQLSHGNGGEGFLDAGKALRDVFHIVSTGEPAREVQAGHLRRSPRRRPAGARGLRFPTKQGTSLHEVIHSVSRAGPQICPRWSPTFLIFSTTSSSSLVRAHDSSPRTASPTCRSLMAIEPRTDSIVSTGGGPRS